jgi:sugar phosphate isomerase/epimerase
MQNLKAIWREILDERNMQDAQWGGPAHDDIHVRSAWCGFIRKFVNRAENTCVGLGREAEYEGRMIQIAALAIAAIESSRRKRGA